MTNNNKDNSKPSGWTQFSHPENDKGNDPMPETERPDPFDGSPDAIDTLSDLVEQLREKSNK